jgi:hypothetical protein
MEGLFIRANVQFTTQIHGVGKIILDTPAMRVHISDSELRYSERFA